MRPNLSADAVQVVLKACNEKTKPETVVTNTNTPSREDHFYVFADRNSLKQWKEDTSVPLVSVVQNFQVYVMRGSMKGEPCIASKQELERDFGSSSVDDAIASILLQGEVRGVRRVGGKQQQQHASPNPNSRTALKEKEKVWASE
uniref:Ribosome maturation protein SDO1/SBDS N-terminal domain-containing protein n=1 Tax=Chromera velia CCMP2878 TaxID=1169474 RepID=A0A0G4G311_9ALVE|eukprot:Cvel_20015.t1-p1 / transcript=Cvel_20015.t1 / gene=Cvel_20015 / organism=Chromera_velia_CCMP2878 / gene_product=hypothetical protein / transcript_product=hypothetical protein / location=Cvel_scaffold1765:32248-33146(+) / protein_length=144 / sequence_SO=supercontig / SO=protein_coding / is_pseudo=false